MALPMEQAIARVPHRAHLKIMSALCEGTWGLIPVGTSKLDFDFRDHADTIFGRVIQNPHWNEWLKEASKNV